MKVKIGELVIVIPFNCIFRQQEQLLQHLYKEFIEEQTFALEVAQSEAKIIIVLSFFISYLSSNLYVQRPVVYYLPKMNKQVESLIKVANDLKRLREKELEQNNTVTIVSNMSLNLQNIEGPILQIVTQRDFLMYIRDHDEVIKNKSIIYFSEVATLDIDCQNVFTFEINETTLRKAAIEKRYLEKKIGESSSEIEFQYRQVLQNIKYSPKTQFLSYNTLFIRCIQYIIGYLKFKQKQLESKKNIELQNKKSFSKKLIEVLAEWTKELYLSADILKAMEGRFLQIIQQFKIDQSKVQCIGSILTFLKNLSTLSEKYEQLYPGAFKCTINLKTYDKDNSKNDVSSIFSYKICCFEPRIIFDRVYVFPRRDKHNKIMLILSSSTPIHKDFFLNNFHLSFDSKIFYDKEISEKNILAMMISSNAFVDLVSDDYVSETHLQIQRSYGTLIIQFANVITDGMIIYVSSDKYLSVLLDEWKKQKIIDTLRTKKCVFIESEKQEVNKMNIRYFKEACDVGKGGIFFFTCRSKSAEVEELKGHYSNAILFLGYPKLNEQDLRNKEKLDYLKGKSYFKDEFLYLEEDAMRHVNKCLTHNIMNNKIEKKIVLFIDCRFNSRLIPHWIEIDEGNLNITQSVDKTIQFSRYNPTKYIKTLLKQTIYI